MTGGISRQALKAGGSAQTFAACEPVLETMGKSITHVGDAGAGHAVKAPDKTADHTGTFRYLHSRN